MSDNKLLPLQPPTGVDAEQYTKTVNAIQQHMDEYRNISADANRRALPLLYKVGTAIKKLFGESGERKYISQLAQDCGIDQQYAYSALAIVNTWTEGQFGKLVDRGLTYSHLVRLVAVRSSEDRKQLTQEVIGANMSVAALERTIKQRAKDHPDYVTARSKAVRKVRERKRAAEATNPAKVLKKFSAKVETLREMTGDVTICVDGLCKAPSITDEQRQQVKELTVVIDNTINLMKELKQLLKKVK